MWMNTASSLCFPYSGSITVSITGPQVRLSQKAGGAKAITSGFRRARAAPAGPRRSRWRFELLACERRAPLAAPASRGCEAPVRLVALGAARGVTRLPRLLVDEG